MGYIAVPRSCLHVRAENTGEDENDHLALTKDFDWTQTLRTLLKTYIAEGYVTRQHAASLLDTSVRTLSRRLSEQGLSYGALLDEVRFSKAKELLQDMDLKILDVARAVGFEDQSAFTRMFRRIGGITPREFRQPYQSG